MQLQPVPFLLQVVVSLSPAGCNPFLVIKKAKHHALFDLANFRNSNQPKIQDKDNQRQLQIILHLMHHIYQSKHLHHQQEYKYIDTNFC